MAKASSTSAPVSDSQPEVKAWSLEDLGFITEEQEVLATRQNSAESSLKQIDERLAKIEADVAIIDPSRVSLPVDYVKELTLAGIFQTTLASAIQGLVLSQPHLLRDAAFQEDAIRKAVNLAETTVQVVAERANLKIKGSK